MIFGTGIDLVEIARFQRAIERQPALLSKLFHRNERRKSSIRSLSARFAAKEAFAKASSRAVFFVLKEIEIISARNRRPRVEILPNYSKHYAFDIKRARVHLSITHDGAMAAAMVMIELP
jgi:holo-[acyl-carrier protein] synthase